MKYLLLTLLLSGCTSTGFTLNSVEKQKNTLNNTICRNTAIQYNGAYFYKVTHRKGKDLCVLFNKQRQIIEVFGS